MSTRTTSTHPPSMSVATLIPSTSASQPTLTVISASDNGSSSRQLKAKIQLNGLRNHQRLIELLTRSATLVRISAQQDCILDGGNHDLWNAGLTVSVRHSCEYYPKRENWPSCTVALKETIFKDMVGLNGELLVHLENTTTPFYEIKETEETIMNRAAKMIIQNPAITGPISESKIISSMMKKYYVEGGVRCIGNFINLRHVFLWDDIVLEVDRCKFPHDEGYFVRFLPDESVIAKVLGLLNDESITYVINLTSKTALFFHGATGLSINTTRLTPGEWTIRLPSGQTVDIQPEDFFDIDGSILDSLKVAAVPAPATLFHPAVYVPASNPQLPHVSFPLLQAPTTLPSSLAPFPVLSTSIPIQHSNLTTGPPVPTMGPASATSTSLTVLPQSHFRKRSLSMEAPVVPSASAPILPDSMSASNTSSNLSNNDNRKPKRGRKSLYSKIMEKSSQGKDFTKEVPQELVSTLSELDVDIRRLDPQAVPEVIKHYQRKRNCEASARYRRKKTSELDQLRDQLAEKEMELEQWKRRCFELEHQLNQRSEAQGPDTSKKEIE